MPLSNDRRVYSMSYQELAKIEQGKYNTRLDFLHKQAPKTASEEIYLLLDPAKVEVIAEAQFMRWAYRLESWRNGLILLPLLITWLSLGLAAFAYVQAYTVHPDQPFLKQWADGFPGIELGILSFIGVQELRVPSFVFVATTDAILIAVLLILTISTQGIESRARRRAARLRSWLEEELYELASTSAVKSLGAGAENKSPAWAVEVHTAISQLNTALKGVEALVESSQKTLTNLVNNSQTTFANLVQASQEKLEDSVRQFGGALSDQREVVKKFMDGTTEMRRAIDQLEAIYIAGEDIYLGLNNTLPKIERAFNTMATRQEQAASALEAISSKTNQATKAVGDIAQQFTQADLVKGTYLAAQHMQQTADAMKKISEDIRKTVNKQSQLQSELGQLASRVPSQSALSPEDRSVFARFQRLFRSRKADSHTRTK